MARSAKMLSSNAEYTRTRSARFSAFRFVSIRLHPSLAFCYSYKAVRAPRFPAEPSCRGLTFMFLFLRARSRRIRERVRTRCDRHDCAVVVDLVDAVLQHLLAGTAWIPRKRVLVPGACHTVARRSDQGVDCHVRAQV